MRGGWLQPSESNSSVILAPALSILGIHRRSLYVGVTLHLPKSSGANHLNHGLGEPMGPESTSNLPTPRGGPDLIGRSPRGRCGAHLAKTLRLPRGMWFRHAPEAKIER